MAESLILMVKIYVAFIVFFTKKINIFFYLFFFEDNILGENQSPKKWRRRSRKLERPRSKLKKKTVQPTFKLHFFVLKLNQIKIKFWQVVQPTFKLNFFVVKLSQIKIKFWGFSPILLGRSKAVQIDQPRSKSRAKCPWSSTI